MGTPETQLSKEMKSLLHSNCMQMVKEFQDKSIQLMEVYKSNPTFPFDFYIVSLRENDTKMQAIREIYKRITNEELQ